SRPNGIRSSRWRPSTWPVSLSPWRKARIRIQDHDRRAHSSSAISGKLGTRPALRTGAGWIYDGGGATAGGWSKMSDKPLSRERGPIERVRARVEALARANAAPRCGARSKGTGKPCRAAAMPNGRCKVHGGKSTGPRTPEGLERSKRARWKHGYYSREAKAERSRVRAAILALRYLRMLGH